MKIVFTGGGSGGHIMPLIAVARELKRLHGGNDLQLHYIGPKDAFWSLLFRQEGIVVHSIVGGKIRRYFSFQNFIDIAFKIPFGFLQSIWLLLFINPQLVFSKGGTGSAAVTYAARFSAIPLFIAESDSVPGLSNRIASKWAKKVFTAFDKTEYFDLSKTITVGNPIRKELLEGDAARAKEVFRLVGGKPLLLFLGGSQGSEAINDFILLALNDLLARYEVLHVAGKKNYPVIQSELNMVMDNKLQDYYHLYESLDEVQSKHAYAAADLIISRSGSGSVFEIAACGKPSILIPLPSDGHQQKNAYQYAQNGAALVIEQQNVTPNFFLGKINYLISNPQELEAMKQAALAFAKPLAAKAIAREILEYLAQ